MNRLALLVFVNQILLAGAIAYVAVRPNAPMSLDTSGIERRVLVNVLRLADHIARECLDRLRRH